MSEITDAELDQWERIAHADARLSYPTKGAVMECLGEAVAAYREIRRERDEVEAMRAERDALAAAVDRVRRRHPRGDEETGLLAPGLWCPTCGGKRRDNGYGGCDDRQALIVPGQPVRSNAPKEDR